MLFARTKATILYDLTAKKVILANNIHTPVYPASLTKKMTLYILFKALKEKKVSLNTKLKISKYAANQPRCRIDLRAGDTMTVHHAICALLVRSCNSTSCVVAENLAGNVPAFVQLMNKTAKDLNLRNTSFVNPSGLHSPKQKTTAWDMAKLACALYRHFPEYRKYFKTKQFMFKGEPINTHNRILNTCPGALGMKTGYVTASGFNLTTVCSRKDKKGKPRYVVSVIIGEDSAQIRDAKTRRLIDQFFRKA